MHFTTAALLIASAGFAAAQTTTAAAATATSSTGCDAENIVQACLSTTDTQVKACAQTDYSCLCSAYQAQLTCYNNCPNDAGRNTPLSFMTSFCQAASGQSALSASSTSASGSGSSTASSGSQSTDNASTTTSGSGSSSTDSSSASAASTFATSTGLANSVVVPAAGSMLAIVLGIFGMM